MFDIGQECCSLVKGGGRVFEVQVEEVEEAITFAKWETSRSCWRAWCLQFLGYKTLKEDSFELKDLKWELNIARTGPLTVHSLCAHFWAPQNSKRFKQKDWILECYKQRKLVDFERFVLNKGRPWRVLGDRGRSLKQKKVNCGTAQEIQKWAQDDLKLIINWLQEQDAKPGPEELESVGAQGILVCLEDAVKSLAENQGLSSVIENWGFLPKAVKELAAIEKGVTEISSSTLEEAERLKGIYDETLKDVLGSRKSANSSEQMKGGVEEGEVDDDATEVMSDINSQETVDYNSDDTIVMEPEAIDECTKKLMQRFVGIFIFVQ